MTPPWVRMLPFVALLAGGLQVLGLLRGAEYYPFAALVGIVACLGLMGWMWRTGKAGLQKPHAGYYWYLAALGCLLLALCTMLVVTLWPQYWSQHWLQYWPQYWRQLRLFHLHANLLGFVGLTVVGTVRVLLPTVVQCGDQRAFGFLHRYLKVALSASLLVAVGAAWWSPLAWVGASLWLWSLAAFGHSLGTQYHSAITQPHSAAISLLFAMLGWGLVLVAGVLHSAGMLSREVLLQLFFLWFLFPLVTGAVSYLLPVWLWPGQQGDRHQRLRQRVVRGSGWRVLGFAVAGALVASGYAGGLYLALLVVVTFVLQIIYSLQRS
jgi:hypothetical protein